MLLGGGSSHHVRLTYISEERRREERKIERREEREGEKKGSRILSLPSLFPRGKSSGVPLLLPGYHLEEAERRRGTARERSEPLEGRQELALKLVHFLINSRLLKKEITLFIVSYYPSGKLARRREGRKKRPFSISSFLPIYLTFPFKRGMMRLRNSRF